MKIGNPVIPVEIENDDEVLFKCGEQIIIKTPEGIIHVVCKISLLDLSFLHSFVTNNASYHGFIFFDEKIGDFRDRLAVWANNNLCIHISKVTCEHVHYTLADGTTVNSFTSSFDKGNYVIGHIEGLPVCFNKATNKEITLKEALAL